MADLGNVLALYLRLMSQSVRAQLQYRMSFLLMAFGNLVTPGVEVLGIRALFERFGRLGDWHLGHVAFLYGLVNAAFAFAGAVVFFYALFIAQAALSFRATESLEIMNTLTYGGTETAQYPLTIHRPRFRLFSPTSCRSVAWRTSRPWRFSAWTTGWVPAGRSRSSRRQRGSCFSGWPCSSWGVGIRHYTSPGS